MNRSNEDILRMQVELIQESSLEVQEWINIHAARFRNIIEKNKYISKEKMKEDLYH